MKEELRTAIEMVKTQVLKEAAQMRHINKVIPVTGERVDLSVGDREINIVYYKANRENAPLILGFHGGGFLFGGNAMNDGLWKAVSDKLGVNVASVEYRKSPQYQYQAALEDAYDAAVYLKNNAEKFSHNPEKISVMGCSAGATLAATVCLYAKQKEEISFENQILMYPFLDSFTDPMSKGEGSLGGPMMYVFNELHCKPEEAKLSLVSPVFAAKEELKGLPRAILCMADKDSLKAEGYQYAKMLEDAGVEVFKTEYKDMPHGFFESGFGEISEGEMAFLGEEVTAMIKEGIIAEVSGKALVFVSENIKG